MSDLHLKALGALCVAGWAAAGAVPAGAQEYPSKTVSIIVPAPAGGGIDFIARLYAGELNKRWKQPVIVDNRPGAAGFVGAEATARAPADGYTLLMTTDSTMTQSIFRKVQFDGTRDLAPIAMTMVSPQVCFTNNETGFKTWQDLVAHAKANPGKLNYVDYPATTVHLYMRRLQKLSGISMTPVPYNGEAPGIQSILGNSTQLFCTVLGRINELVKAGKVTALGVTSREPVAALPAVPTFRSMGIDFEWPLWFGLMVPSGVPREVLAKLQADVAEIQKMPEVLGRVSATGLLPETRPPAASAAEMTATGRQFKDMAKEFGIQPE
jgi:tripartite-type tricarboxylate transporter receptor subunit TctC